jgi:NAD(P)-dependent dehydrogenase (short-subunit alcohol dehydrogenase family)
MSRVVLITGVTAGLGRAMAEGFAREGHRVAGCGRDVSALESLENTLGRAHHFTRVDVANDQEVSDWIGSVTSTCGIPDLVINNAATINANAPLWTISATEFDRVIDINIKGVQNVIRHVVPPMVDRGSGMIVNFSSGWGRSTSPDVAPYCATKWAIEGLTQALAQELPSGMAAIPLNPGIINTEMLQSCLGSRASQFEDAKAWAEKAVPFLLNLSTKDNGQSLSAP